MLNKEQLKAVQHFRGPALVLAVPGAGKTTVLIHRINNLISKYKVEPSRILSITFSRASAKDMQARFLSSFGQMPGLKFSTIHSFSFFIVRDYARKMGLHYRLIEDYKDPINKYNILRQIYSHFNGGNKPTEDKMEALINKIGYLQNMMEMPDSKSLESVENFVDIFHSYQSFKKKNNYIDFDDMLSLSYKILKEDKQSLSHYQKQYDFIQLDEGQDTSKIQMEIIKLLSASHNNIFIVADDDQSIYGFRGADPSQLFSFKDEFKDIKIFFMQENFRSSKNIVQVSNKLIKNNSQRFNKEIYTNNKYLRPVSIIRLNGPKDQYDYIIKDLKKHGHNSSSAVLFRNNISSIGLIDSLEREGLDFNLKDGNLKFFKHWVLRDILDFLRFAQDTSNLKIYNRIFYKKKGYVSKLQLSHVNKLSSDQCLIERLKSSPGIEDYQISILNELKEDFKVINSLSPEKAIDHIKFNLGYLNWLKDFSEKFGHNYSSVLAVLNSLVLISRGTENLDDFELRLLNLSQLSRNKVNNSSSLSISTIHSAKGLEFDRVYLIDLINNEIPSLSSQMLMTKEKDFKAIEEERRLFYVALTRAKTHLTLFTFDRLADLYIEPSCFIREIK